MKKCAKKIYVFLGIMGCLSVSENVNAANTIRCVMPKQTDYLDLIERLKVPGYLDSLEHLFQKTERTKTIPLMIKKKIGLHDGKIWTYENIGNELGWVSNIKKKDLVFILPIRVV